MASAAMASSSTSTSPSKHNPFARQATAAPASFSRTSLLPLRSPVREARRPSPPPQPQSTPAAVAPANPLATPGERRKQTWRVLWRGGLEVGPDGWRMDGITFFALLSFGGGTTPKANPFAPPTPLANAATASPRAPDADLCLSLESMRGRRHLPVRAVVPLTDEDVIEADDGGVQMSITSPLLAAYFTGLLCRAPKLTPLGRTTSAIIIGLGDEGVDAATSSVIIYGQRQADTTLRLCVSRRRIAAPPSVKKIRPGEPLPRAPLFFPAKAPRKPPPPFPSRRSLSRATSVSSIYAPPLSAGPHSANPLTHAASLPPAPLSGRTPGRRGEKRRRTDEPSADDSRRRKAGRIVPERQSEDPEVKVEEDIFGGRSTSAPRAQSVAPRAPSVAPRPQPAEPEAESSTRAKRPRVPQQILDNKATIRKQTLLLLESRGCPREHTQFKDVFGMTTKGAYFAFRDVLETGPLDKGAVQDIVRRHLDMYLSTPLAAAEEANGHLGTDGTCERREEGRRTSKNQAEHKDSDRTEPNTPEAHTVPLDPLHVKGGHHQVD